MLDKDDIQELKQTHLNLKRKLERYGEKPESSALMLSTKLQEYLEDIDSTLTRSKDLYNPALITKVKLAKKGFKLSKGINSLELEVASEFEKGSLSVNAGKKMISTIKWIKSNKLEEAKEEFRYLEEFINLNKQFAAAGEALEEAGRVLKREEHRLENALKELEELENQKLDENKLRIYAELADSVQHLEKARESYIDSLLALPIPALLDSISTHPQKDRLPNLPEGDELIVLKSFLAGCRIRSVEDLCGHFDLNEKRLSHVCPDIAGFKKIVFEKRALFEELRFLKKSKFLAVDINDDAVLDYYAAGIAGTKDAVGRIRDLRAQKQSAEAEFEKSQQIERKRVELSKYSKKGLEDELAGILDLIKLLESEEKEVGGLLGKISSLFSGR